MFADIHLKRLQKKLESILPQSIAGSTVGEKI